LLQHRADVNATDAQGQSALFMAARTGSASVITLLLDAQASVDMADHHGNTALFEAARLASRTDAIDALLARGANANHQNNDGQTALFVTARSMIGTAAQMSTSKKLLDGKCNVSAMDNAVETVLFTAVRAASEPLARLFIEHGARVDVVSKCVPAQIAQVGRRTGNAKATRAGVGSGKIMKGTKLAFTKTCLSAKPGSVSGGVSPLHLATDHVMTRLLLQSGAPVNAQDANKCTALDLAAVRDDVASVRVLVVACADANISGYSSALDAAIAVSMKVSLDMVQVLVLEAFAKPSRETVKEAQKNGQQEFVHFLKGHAARWQEHGDSPQDYKFLFSSNANPVEGADIRHGHFTGVTAIESSTPEYQQKLIELATSIPWSALKRAASELGLPLQP
jgi:ankyrin repeat protein